MTAPPRPPSLVRLALPGILLFLAVEAILTATVWLEGPGRFAGPDPYMRLTRVLECRGGFSCPEGLLLRSNVPRGEVLHWPFLMDWLILLLALPFRPFMPFRDAVIAAGYQLGPLLGVGAMLTLTGAARTILVDRAARWTPLLASVLFWALYAFAPVRPDHHGLQVLLFLLVLLGTLRIVTDRTRLPSDEEGASVKGAVEVGPGPAGEGRAASMGKAGSRPAADPRPRGAGDATGSGAWIAGLGLGTAIWVSTEGLASTAPLLAALAAVWVGWGGERLTAAHLRIWLVVSAVLALGLLVDGPQPERWAVEFDRFSVVHLTAAGLVALFWAGVHRRVPPTSARRAAVLGAGAVVATGILVLLFPGVERGPMADLEPALVPLWVDHISEFVPARTLGTGTWGVMAVAPGLLALLVGARLTPGRGSRGWTAVRPPGTGPRLGWAVVSVSLVWFLALTILQQVRWAHYVHILAPLGLAALLARLLAGVARARVPPLARAGGTVALVLLFVSWPPVLLLLPLGDRGLRGSGAVACPMDPLVAPLRRMEGPGGRRPRVLAQVFWGSELLFRADVDVVAGPYHRNAEGMLDSWAIMSASDPGEARRHLEEREIDAVVLCATQDWIPLVRADSAGTLYHELVRGRPPDWLRPVPLPGVPERYRLYEVEPRATEGE